MKNSSTFSVPDNDTAILSDEVDTFPVLSNDQSDGRSSHMVISDCDCA